MVWIEPLADYTGMLATIINSLILQKNFWNKRGFPLGFITIEMDTVCELYIRRRAMRHIEKKRIVIFVNVQVILFFTTDTSQRRLRASEMK